MRIVICDNHRVFADTLGVVMVKRGHEVVSCTSTPEEGVAAVRAHQPHLLITELSFPEGDGAAAVAAARQSSPGTLIVVLSGSKEVSPALVAKQAGAHAFLSKKRPLADILSRIDEAAAGVVSFFDGLLDGDAVGRGADGAGGDVLRFLTSREREVLERLVKGQDTATLAQEMGVTYSTARTHIQNLLCKLGVHSKLEAVALGITLLPSSHRWSERRPLSKTL